MPKTVTATTLNPAPATATTTLSSTPLSIFPTHHRSSGELVKPAGSLYIHNLTSTLETAVRATNAQYAPSDVLARLDAKLFEVSPGDSGWDVRLLRYHFGTISHEFSSSTPPNTRPCDMIYTSPKLVGC